MKKIILLLILFTTEKIFAQSSDEAAVRKVLETQNAAWNRGDVDAFMVGYWHSDSLMFIGKSGVTYGWQNTLNNYKKNYPDTATMGYLTRTVGDVGGHFTLLFKKINDEWVIIEDHTS
jgi:ketosteroid isomerase-like protein